MDFFDERVLATLKDRKPKSFATLLSEVSFSHNTLQQHLERLTAKALLSGRNLLQRVSEDPNLPIMFPLGPQSRLLQHSKTPRWNLWLFLSVV